MSDSQRNIGVAAEPTDQCVIPARDGLNITARLGDMLVRNPAPDASPSREPIGIHRVVKLGD